jgi:HEAT repeat protein
VGRLLEHRDPEVRLKAVSTLGTLHAEALVPRLAEIVLEKSWLRTKKTRSLQVAAARALAEIGTDKALETLHKVISQGPGDLRAVCQELM